MSNSDSIKAQIIIRNYVMERFLERLSLSKYHNNIILKGGTLVAAMVGLDNRSTMDIDTTIKNLTLTEENVKIVVKEIISIHLEDGMSFEIKSVDTIMDEADYSGIRVMLDATLETMRIPFKIDFSAGDAITPREVSYSFKLLFEDRTISIWAYNLETILAEKIETLISRGTVNTRMRDFYDIFILESTQMHNVDDAVLKMALDNTCKRRGSKALIGNMKLILDEIADNHEMQILWKNYQRKFDYAAEIKWDDVIQTVKKLCNKCNMG